MLRITMVGAALAASILMLGGCQTMGPQGGYVSNAAEIVKAADWSKMQTVTLTLDDHGYSPQHLVFKAGQPYKLQLRNLGEKDHYYTAPEFYKAIATRKAMVNKNAEVKAPYLDAVEVLKNHGELDLYFVPVVKGNYQAYCTIEDHRAKGVEGTILIE